ncbi:MAG: hypothetical protein ACOY90_19610 [Candidatus Zhuqueibacterota bacterium]
MMINSKMMKFILPIILLLSVKLCGMNWQTYGLYKTGYMNYRNTLFNPDNITVDEIGMVNRDWYFSQYLSLQARMLSVDWRIDLLGASTYETDWDANLRVKQLYFQKDVFGNLSVMAGRILLNWGAGYAFNPANVVAPQKELSDPDNTERRMQGNDLAKLEYFGESYSIALAYLTEVNFDEKIRASQSRLAVRLYKNILDCDVSLIALANKAEAPILAGNFAYVIGERLEIHGEFAAQKGSYQVYHRAITNAETFYYEYPLALLKRDDDQFYHQYVIGINYTLLKNIGWILEYYHRDQGYSKQEWQQVIRHVEFVSGYFSTPYGELARGNLLWSANVFSSKGAMRDYVMNYITIPVTEALELKSTSLINLNDLSFITIPEIALTLKNHFTFYGRSYIFEGKAHSEYGELFQSFSIEGGIRLNL